MVCARPWRPQGFRHVPTDKSQGLNCAAQTFGFIHSCGGDLKRMRRILSFQIQVWFPLRNFHFGPICIREKKLEQNIRCLPDDMGTEKFPFFVFFEGDHKTFLFPFFACFFCYFSSLFCIFWRFSLKWIRYLYGRLPNARAIYHFGKQ